MKRKFYILTALLASVTLAVSSCEQALEEVVYSSLTQDIAFTTGENAQGAVDAMYIPLHQLYREPMWMINDIPTDVGVRAYCSEWLNDEQEKVDNIISDVYHNFTQIYSRANDVICIVPTMDDELFDTNGVQSKDLLVAQAQFMRAYAYYELTDIYYQVPLVITNDEDVSAPSEFASIDDIETQIEADLKACVNALPKSWERTQAQRPTYGAAEAFLVRLYMRQAGRARLAGDAGKATEKWNAALSEVNKVLALEGEEYQLYPDVWTAFDPTTDDALYNDELIWAVRASRDVHAGSWDLGLMCTPWEYDMGWDCYRCSLELYWSFDPEDTRLTELIVDNYPDVYNDDFPDDPWYYMAPPTIKDVGRCIEILEGMFGPGAMTYDEHSYVSTQKYMFLGTWTYNYDTPNNFPIVRLPDMILCKAEILNELKGPNQESIDLINRIRERAFTNAEHNLSLGDYSSTDALRSAICDERAWELNSEAMRRPDLIRMGLWKDRYDKYVESQKEKAYWKAINTGNPEGFYDDEYKAYPTDLTENDVRRYFPMPLRETELNPELANARTF